MLGRPFVGGDELDDPGIDLLDDPGIDLLDVAWPCVADLDLRVHARRRPLSFP